MNDTGAQEGLPVGDSVASPGTGGSVFGKVGATVGDVVSGKATGERVGDAVSGRAVGATVGGSVSGKSVGGAVGDAVSGRAVGVDVGADDGATDGCEEINIGQKP